MRALARALGVLLVAVTTQASASREVQVDPLTLDVVRMHRGALEGRYNRIVVRIKANVTVKLDAQNTWLRYASGKEQRDWIVMPRNFDRDALRVERGMLIRSRGLRGGEPGFAPVIHAFGQVSLPRRDSFYNQPDGRFLVLATPEASGQLHFYFPAPPDADEPQAMMFHGVELELADVPRQAAPGPGQMARARNARETRADAVEAARVETSRVEIAAPVASTIEVLPERKVQLPRDTERLSRADTTTPSANARAHTDNAQLARVMEAIHRKWNIPPGSADRRVALDIEQDERGLVTHIAIATSSGDAAFDQSAMMAVLAASPLPQPSAHARWRLLHLRPPRSAAKADDAALAANAKAEQDAARTAAIRAEVRAMMQADRARKEQERKNVQEARARALAIEQAKEAARLQARREQQIALAAARAHYAEKARPLSNGPQMKRLQIVLAKLGFDPGTPDGVEGKRTRAAVKAFEARHKLPVTGIATTSVLVLAERKLQRN